MCGCLHVPPAGDVACNLGTCPDWEWDCDPLVHRPVLSPLSHTSQGLLPVLDAMHEIPGMGVPDQRTQTLLGP